ncbi:hypothetical protein [Thermovibrio sp.]
MVVVGRGYGITVGQIEGKLFYVLVFTLAVAEFKNLAWELFCSKLQKLKSPSREPLGVFMLGAPFVC